MILQFSITNYRSFKERATLSLVASNYDKDTRESENIIANEKFNLRILKSAVIYGANAGGKSKFIEAMIFMKNFILYSSKDTQKGDPIAVEPFRLNSDSVNQGSEFEIVFKLKNNLYRYGFEVDKKKVIAEWLYNKTKTRENELFYRDFQEIEFKTKKLSKLETLANESLVRDNALVLSVLAQFNDNLAESFLDWFKDLKVISGLKEEGYINNTMLLSKNESKKDRILSFMKNADIGIDNFKLKKRTFEELDFKDDDDSLPKELKDALKGLNSYVKRTIKEENREIFSDVITYHKQYDSEGNFVKPIEFSLQEDESSGTRKFFALIGQIINSIDNGSVLFVDELDSKIHPNLVCKIIAIYNSREFNPNNAQLVFNSHDTNLLGSGLFRRDQVWFVKKDNYAESKLYSLADFKTADVRKNEAFENNYLRGKYGAVPFLGDFDDVIQNL